MLRIGSPLLVWFASVWLIGCSSGNSASPPATAPAVTTSSAPSPQPATTVTTNALPTQGEYPGITITIQELKRSSSALTLRFVMTNQSRNDLSFGYSFGEGNANVADFGSIAGIHLIDGANKKKYFVVRDSDGACLCSRHVPNIAAGSQAVLWAKFPVPSDDVQKITVEIPHFPPFEDVAIGR